MGIIFFKYIFQVFGRFRTMMEEMEVGRDDMRWMRTKWRRWNKIMQRRRGGGGGFTGIHRSPDSGCLARRHNSR